MNDLGKIETTKGRPEDGPPRRRLSADQARNRILDAAEKLMRRDGYAAVTTKRVAQEAGLKPPLVHYHFETTEKLLVTLYRRATSIAELALASAVVAEDPLKAIWDFNTDRNSTVLAAEFLALANHRDSIKQEMAADVERVRAMQATALRPLADVEIGDSGRLGEEAAATLIAAVARALIAEDAVGISTGHERLESFVKSILAQLRP